MRPVAYELKYDEVFKADYKREMRAHPELLDDFKAAVRELAATGTVPAEYSPHPLTNEADLQYIYAQKNIFNISYIVD